MADGMAGLTFALVNIPQAMANALLANVNPLLGLYTLAIGTPIGAIFTGSVFMNVSTTSALSLAAGDVVGGMPASQRAVNLMVLVLMVGIVQLVAGIFKLGSLTRFVSKSVMIGFTTGIALLIVLGQIGDLTGYDSRFNGKISQALDTTLNWKQINAATFATGLLTIGLVAVVNRTKLRKFSLVISLIISTLFVQLFRLNSVALVGELIDSAGALGDIELSDIHLTSGLLMSAVAVAIIGLVQGAGVSQSYANPDGKYPNVSRDFVGQGMANIATSLFQGIPAGGSMSGTALVVSAGARSRWANIWAGLLVIPIVLIFAQLIGYVPMPTLAGLLIVVGIQSLQPNQIRTVWQTGLIPQVGFGLTLMATLTLPLQTAVFIGVAVSVLLYVFRSANLLRLVELEMVANGYPIERSVPEALEDDQTIVLHAYGSFFFAAASNLEEQFPDVGKAQHTVVILRLRGRDEVGSTFIAVLERYGQILAAQNGRLMLCGVGQTVWSQLQRTGIIDQLGEDGIFMAEAQLGVSLNEALETAVVWHEAQVEEK